MHRAPFLKPSTASWRYWRRLTGKFLASPTNRKTCARVATTRDPMEFASWPIFIQRLFSKCSPEQDITGHSQHQLQRPCQRIILPIFDSRGVNLPPLTQMLKDVEYNEWFTNHQPLLDGQSVHDVILNLAEFISPSIKQALSGH